MGVGSLIVILLVARHAVHILPVRLLQKCFGRVCVVRIGLRLWAMSPAWVVRTL